MSDFRVDDAEYDAPGIAAVSLAAYGLWMKARGYAARHRTGDRITLAMLLDLARAAGCSQSVAGGVGTGCEQVDELLCEHLCERDANMIVFVPQTPTEKRRAGERLRMASKRAAQCEQAANTDANSVRTGDANSVRTSRARAPRAIIVDQSEEERREPSVLSEQGNLGLVVGGGVGEGGGIAARKRRRLRAVETEWPADLMLTDSRRQFARDGGLDPEMEWGMFRSNHKAKGSRFRDWDQAWETWCRRSVMQFHRGVGARQAR